MTSPLSLSGQPSPGSPEAASGRQIEELFRIEGLTKRFGELQVLKIDRLAIHSEEILVIVGPSGCGKTTLLQCLAGLERVSEGEIRFRGREVLAPLSTVGMVFQRSSIFPWFTVRQNLSVRGTALAELSDEAVDAAIARFGLAQFGSHWPRQLSGGMSRRLELARAMLREPAALLLDEPFSALDPVIKAEMHQLVRQLRRDHGVCIVLVTHDVDEAIALADRILVLSRRPGSITAEIRVNVPDAERTIHSTDNRFVAARQTVLEALGWGTKHV